MKFELTVTDEAGAKATVELFKSKNWIPLIDDLQKMFIPAETHPLYKFYNKERRMEKVTEELADFMRFEMFMMFRDMIDVDKGVIKGYCTKWINKEPTEQNRLDMD